MDRPTVPLRRDVYEQWSQLQAYLGFSDTSDFADHIMAEYKSRHNLTAEILVTRNSTNGSEAIINGITVKQEMVEGESCESADTSGKTSPDLDYLRPKDNADKPSSRKRKQRSSWGLESVVQRLHQAKVAKTDGKDEDGWIYEGDPPAAFPPRQNPASGESAVSDSAPSSPLRGQKLSEEEYAYTSPKIIHDSTKSLQDEAAGGHGVTPEGFQDPSYTLRRLLERPPVNASAELRRNAAELEERGVVINPAMYDQAGRRGPPPPYDARHQNPGNEPPTAEALDSLIRRALQAKGEGGVHTEAELLRTIKSHGGAPGDLPHALEGAPNDSPSLKNILQRGGPENYIASSLSVQDKEKPYGMSGAETYNIPSAAYALQHLAQMRGPENVPLVLRPTAPPRTPKKNYSKRQKLGEKSRRKHKSGSRRKNGAIPPTVKSLLDRKDASPTKYRGRTHSSKGVQKAKSKKKSKEGRSTTGKRGRKKNRATPVSPSKVHMRTPSPPPAAINIDHSAAQVMKMMAGQETAPPPAAFQSPVQVTQRDPRQGVISIPTHVTRVTRPRILQHRNSASPIVRSSTSPFPGFKSYSPSPSPNLTNSASEVMKLLASQNLSRSTPMDQPPTLNPVSQSSPVFTASQMGQMANQPRKTPDQPPPSLGAASIMKQLATNYSQSAATDTKFPLPGLMFCGPSIGDSSSAFSLMKELITKGSS